MPADVVPASEVKKLKEKFEAQIAARDARIATLENSALNAREKIMKLESKVSSSSFLPTAPEGRPNSVIREVGSLGSVCSFCREPFGNTAVFAEYWREGTKWRHLAYAICPTCGARLPFPGSVPAEPP